MQLLTCRLDHVVEGTVAYSSMLEDGANLTTLGGENVTISIEDGNVFVNSAQVTMPDVLVSNGVVHVIDKYEYLFQSLMYLR